MLGSNTLRSIGLFAFLALSLTLAGCSSNSADTDRGANTAAKSEGVLSNVFETAKPVTIPEGTAIHIVLDQSLTSNRSHAGDDFEASISEPVVVAGKTVIPKGARVHGRVTEASEAGHLHHPASLRLTLRSVEVGGKSYAIETSSIGRAGPNHNKRNVEYIGGGAAAGALIGALAGGGKGALIGSAVGAGAGTAGAAAT
ncbi:MAG: hypothetical protein DMG29_12605, partial [Acidobacteria bacterium]